jgi:hypothetical protein
MRRRTSTGGIALSRQGRLQEALQDLDAAVASAPGTA